MQGNYESGSTQGSGGRKGVTVKNHSSFLLTGERGNYGPEAAKGGVADITGNRVHNQLGYHLRERLYLRELRRNRAKRRTKKKELGRE